MCIANPFSFRNKYIVGFYNDFKRNSLSYQIFCINHLKPSFDI